MKAEIGSSGFLMEQELTLLTGSRCYTHSTILKQRFPVKIRRPRAWDWSARPTPSKELDGKQMAPDSWPSWSEKSSDFYIFLKPKLELGTSETETSMFSPSALGVQCPSTISAVVTRASTGTDTNLSLTGHITVLGLSQHRNSPSTDGNDSSVNNAMKGMQQISPASVGTAWVGQCPSNMTGWVFQARPRWIMLGCRWDLEEFGCNCGVCWAPLHTSAFPAEPDIWPLYKNFRHLLILCHQGTDRWQTPPNTAWSRTKPAPCVSTQSSAGYFWLVVPQVTDSSLFLWDSSKSISVTITSKVSVPQVGKSQCLTKLSPPLTRILFLTM